MSTIQTPSTLYSFTYGNFALRTQVKAGSRTLATYTYTAKDNYLDRLVYGNEDVVQYIYDEKGRIIEKQYGYIEQTEGSEAEASVPTTHITDTVTYSYDCDGTLAQVEDDASGITLKYFYDLTERIAKYTETGTGFSNTVSYAFDQKGNMTQMLQKINGTDRETTYTYDDDNRVVSQDTDGTIKNYNYDSSGRPTMSTVMDGGSYVVDMYYDYNDTATRKSPQVSQVTAFGETDMLSYSYTYDDNGNIATYTQNGHTTTYTYDSANQLIQVDAPDSDAVWQYTYDDAGNLTSSTRYPYSPPDELGIWGYDEYMEYEYTDSLGWGDLLTKYGNYTITYDEIGNPLNDGTWTYTWEHGRQLASMSRTGTTWNFTYNADGLRTKRTNGTKTYTYGYIGDQLWYYKVNDQEFFISWDANGRPLSITTDTGETYYYITNLQGDVTALMDDTGAVTDTYAYTPWGTEDWISSISTSIGNLNPLRYRSYVYDSETGLYYLQSRYYDPEMGRFINADGLVSTGQGILSKNMFAYCGNNPISRTDDSGMRYCAGTTISNESSEERGISCRWQKYIQIDNPTPLDRWEVSGVKFVPDSSGNGGQIVNSYKISDSFQMAEYARYLLYKSKYSSHFSGSIEGFLFEWDVHNVAYQMYTSKGDKKNADRAKDLDVGRTIYADNHDYFTYAMLLAYEFLFPVQAEKDRMIHNALIG